jgi:hypothetical protein
VPSNDRPIPPEDFPEKRGSIPVGAEPEKPEASSSTVTGQYKPAPPADEESVRNLAIIKWTRALAIWTGLLVIVSLCSALIAFFQWRSQDKADQTTRDASVALQRAFLIFQRLNVSVGRDQAVEHWVPIWENTGNTPTKSLVIRTGCRISETSIGDPFNFPQTSEFSRTFAGPKNIVYGDGCHPLRQQIEEVKGGKQFFYIFGDATYEDVFGVKHVTEFCQVLRAGYQLTSLCSAHNCADQECH